MAPQQLASAVVTTTSPYTGPPVGSVPEVIKRLEEIQSYAEAHEVRGQHDGVACFTYLYHRITTRVLEGIDTVALCRISAHVRCLFRLQLQVR